jgi:hypothetical protein
LYLILEKKRKNSSSSNKHTHARSIGSRPGAKRKKEEERYAYTTAKLAVRMS